MIEIEHTIKKSRKADDVFVDEFVDEIVDKVNEILGELETKGREETIGVVFGAALLWYISRRKE